MNDAGRIIADYWNKLLQRFSNIELDEYIVMPNHFHGIIKIVGAGFPRPDIDRQNIDDHMDKGRGDRAPTLGQMMAYFKYGTTKKINQIRNTQGRRIWQRNYHDHIIRDESDLNRIREYITHNPAKWDEDDYYDI